MLTSLCGAGVGHQSVLSCGSALEHGYWGGDATAERRILFHVNVGAAVVQFPDWTLGD
ncbi:hypothetical protein [Streptomyces winkii]|uniref:hypothetical protein n=1 Tax=Streptomyces winkii TaxID=3051178 RepID=UPI0028D2A0A5|nr:hypothetical protein [Streptomyces sp. DSM 40971]